MGFLLLFTGVVSIWLGLWLAFSFPGSQGFFTKGLYPRSDLLLTHAHPDLKSLNDQRRAGGWSEPVENNPVSLAEWISEPQSTMANSFVRMIGWSWATTGVPAVACAGLLLRTARGTASTPSAGATS